ncbi:sirohydrochlorin cobaltochelatase [Ferrimonas aestuarii]|uniref:Sirohydrochlorin cobaltochelatase n=1 Tax=Ferrimonas aestuarii TaxID=2569539 RepID=A0A4U1BFX4_9GAMM|nr:sirohydrochlorin cobaltochelatase [Ferrimonas aestuarii]TKB50029.1 sirohydrochlorin cobaltochelatase [Ferrimonas aestuarii]
MKATALCFTSLLLLAPAMATADTAPTKPQQKSAIVLAAFGTSYDSALNSLLHIQQDIQAAYPNTPIRFAFTSNIIRKKWHRRQHDEAYKQAHPEVPESLYQVKNVLGALADLQNDGYKNIVVQTTLLTPGEEFHDLGQYVDALNGIDTLREKWKPFNHIALGRPLMGQWGVDFPYHQDLNALAGALAKDVELAKSDGAALVYMGHGNEHLSTGLYSELQTIMQSRYPNQQTYVGLVEGAPNLEQLKAQLTQDGITKVHLRPLMVVAGDHASNDMAGDEPDSWKSQLQQLGIKVTPILQGLGNNPSVRQRYLTHLQDAASSAEIVLN